MTVPNRCCLQSPIRQHQVYANDVDWITLSDRLLIDICIAFGRKYKWSLSSETEIYAVFVADNVDGCKLTLMSKMDVQQSSEGRYQEPGH